MKIDIYATHNSVHEKEFKDRVVVVVDVLRATTTIITATYNGCKEIIPVAGIEEAIAFSRNYEKKSLLLGGERNTKKIEGFDLSNSPSEYSRQVVEGRTIIITTTNGTKAIKKTNESKKTLIAGFVNVGAVASVIDKIGEDVSFICAGTDGKFSLEDVLAVGAVLSRLKTLGNEIILDDLGFVCLNLFDRYKNDVYSILEESVHFKKLKFENLEQDINVCLALDSIPVVPYYKDGVIKMLNNSKV